MKVVLFSIVISYLSPYHVYPFAAFYNDWLVILAIVVFLAFHLESRYLKFQTPSIIFVPIGITGIIVLQVLLRMIPFVWDAILPIFYLIVAALAIILGATASVSGPNGARRICDALAYAHLTAGLLSVGIATVQIFGQEAAYGSFTLALPHGLGVAARPYANMAQPNQLALLFCMAIAAVWWLFQTEQIKKPVSFFVVLFLLWGLVLTQSRIGWLIIPAFASLVWYWRRGGNFLPISSKVLTLLLLLYGVAVLMLPELGIALGFDVMSPSAHMGTGAGSERLKLAQQAWRISRDHPFLGAGWYQFGAQQVNIGADFASSVYSQYAHNLILNFAAELGWPATLIVLGALGYWFINACFVKRIKKEVGFASLFFVAVAIHSMVEFPLWYAYVLLPVALLIGMVHQEQFSSRTITFSRKMVASACVVMSLALIAVAVDYRQVVVGFRALGWEALGLTADEGTTIKPAFTMFPQFFDYFHFAKTRAHKGMRPEEIADMERIMHRFGYAPVLMRMSLVYALNGRDDDAVRTMMTLSRLHPNRYAEAYEAWKGLASVAPESYLAVFNRLPSH